MASTDKAELETTVKAASPPPPPPLKAAGDTYWLKVDVWLRLLLFASTLTALLVVVTSKETVMVQTLLAPFPLPLQAKFDQSPAFIYFVAALAVASFYSLITALASILVMSKPIFALRFLLFFILSDVVMLGVVASATGTAGGVAYIGLKGNSHAQWGKVCPTFGKYCRHLGASIALSLNSSFLLVFLIFLSLFSLHKKLPK